MQYSALTDFNSMRLDYVDKLTITLTSGMLAALILISGASANVFRP